MFTVISYLLTIYDFLIVSPLSVLIGFFFGGITGLSVRLPKSGLSLVGLFGLLCLSPRIGRNVYLVKTMDVSILLNCLLFAATLATLVTMLYRYYKLDQKPYSKQN